MKQRIFGIFLMVFSMGVNAKVLTIKVTGIEGALADNVHAYLSNFEPLDPEHVGRLKTTLEKKSHQALQALGYFHPTLTLQQHDDQLEIVVQAGAPVIIKTITVRLKGEAEQDTAYQSFLKKLPLKAGDVLDQGKYQSIKASLQSIAANRGYHNAHFIKSQLIVDPQRNESEVVIDFDSGKRYRFGDNVIASPYSDVPFIHELLTLPKGDFYQAHLLSKQASDLAKTQYFKDVSVRPLWDKAKDNYVPIEVKLSPKVANSIGLGLGYSTDEGVRFKLNWQKPWINDKGHRLSSDLALSLPKQAFTFEYLIPNGNPLSHFYSVQTEFQHIDQNDTLSSKLSLSFNRQDQEDKGWGRRLFVRLDGESYTQGTTKGASLLVLPGVTYWRTRSQGGLDPFWGDRLKLTLEAAPPGLGADVWLTRIYGEAKLLRRYADKHYMILGASQGIIGVDDFEKVPASMRFFAGGDQSVRGFGYNSISPLDSAGEKTGARYLSTVNLEYQYQFLPKWRLALFTDTGTATNDYQDPWKVGVGTGLRWITPVGPISIDFAFGVSETHIPFQIHFSIGPEL